MNLTIFGVAVTSLINPLIIVLTGTLILRRLAGIRRGQWAATILSIIIGEATTLVILQAITGHAVTLPWSWYPVGIGMITVFSMAALYLIDWMIPTSDQARAWQMPRPWSTLTGFIRRGRRYAQVGWIAIRRGLFNIGDDATLPGSKLGRALASTFEDAGGLFVKLGQAMAAQPQLVTPEIAAALSRLDDQAAPADPRASLAVIREEIGQPEEIFASFDNTPVAAASLAQTYFATLHDGRPVVVKVQRPGISKSVERDLDIVIRLCDQLNRRTSWARAIGLTELVAGFADTTREELDYRIEAANCMAASASLAKSDPIVVPRIVEKYTTRRILVEERVEGRSVGDPTVFDGIGKDDRQSLADGLLAFTVRQMIGGERFHADPHPGNVFLCPDGRLGLIDFGAVGQLTLYERSGLTDLFRGLQTEDPSLLRQAALHIGTATGRVDSDSMDRSLARLLSHGTRPDGTLNPDIFGETLGVFRDYGIVMPRSTTTLFRTLATLLATLDAISPGYQVIEGISRVAGDLMAPSLSPSGIKETVKRNALTLGPILARLPRDVDEMTRTVQRGELRAQLSLFSEPADARFIESMFSRLVTTLVGGLLLIASALLLGLAPHIAGQIGALTITGGIGMGFSVLLLLRTLVRAPQSQEIQDRETR